MPRCGCASDCLCSVVGSGCVTVVGSGSPAVPYTIGLSIDPDENNALVCGEAGLFTSGGLTPAYGVLIDNGSSPTVLPPALAGAPSRAQWLADTDPGSVNVASVVAGAGSLPQAYFQCLAGFGGLYFMQTIISGWTAGPAATGDVIFRVGIGLLSVGGASGMAATTVYTSAAAPYNIPAVLTSAMFTMDPGDQAWVEIAVEDYSGPFPGATLTQGPTYDGIPTAGFAATIHRVAA